MKIFRRMFAGVLVVMMLSSLFSGGFVGTFAATSGNIYYIEPKLGDGASLNKNELDDLYVKGVYNNKRGTFTFSETRVLTFTVKFDKGWSYSEEYSSVFKGDAGSLVVSKGSNSVTFKYTASSGKSVDFTVLKNVCINTTPDEMPKLYLNVSGSFDNVTKDEWVDCDVRLTLGTKKYSSGNFVGAGQVKGRGQSSWGKDQKPYSINFEQKTSLLDIPATKKYAIISTYQDESLIRNLVMYSAAQNLKGIDYVVKAEPVEVYLNNQYNGIYTLCERVRISNTQIKEEEASPENISGAYLLEKTVTGKMYSINGVYVDQYFAAPYIGHPEGNKLPCDTFVFKDPDEVNDAMINYASGVINGVHDAVMSSSDTLYKQYIDVDSWVDFIIMQEVAKNVDADLKTSTLMLIPSNSKKLAFTSLWDFDLAFGNATHNNDGSGYGITISGTPNANTVSKFMTIQPSCPWFVSLYEKDSFKQAIKERYTEYRHTVIEDLINKIDYYSAYVQKSVGNKVAYVEANEVAEAVDDFKEWLDKRLQWLDSQWLLDTDDSTPHRVSVKVSGKGDVISSDGSSAVTDGGVKTYSISPAAGYDISKVTFDGRDVTSQVKLGTYTTPYITKDASLVVTFVTTDTSAPADSLYSIFVDSVIENGTVSVNNDTAAKGTVITVTATPAEGYVLNYISVDGTILSENTFVMPARDVTVSAEFSLVVSADENRKILLAAMDVASGAKLKAVANQSSTTISDTYNNAISHADMVYADEEASPESINAAAMELMRMFGIMCRDDIKADQLAIMIRIGEMYAVSEDVINAAKAAQDDAAIKTAWDSVVDASMPTSTSVLLESLCAVYTDVKAEEYTEASFALFTDSLNNARSVLADPSAKQSVIDAATADLSYTGRSLMKGNGKGEQGGSDPDSGNGMLHIVVMVVSIVLAVVAIPLAGFAAAIVIKRRKTT